jgi:mRNA interferase RelE/StbE
MRYAVVLAPEALEDLQVLPAATRAQVKSALEIHLRHEPMKLSRSRIKRLRGISRPQIRLRVDEIRVFYDVAGAVVEVLAIAEKAEALSWLAKFGSLE